MAEIKEVKTIIEIHPTNAGATRLAGRSLLRM
jgi:hypothetical protein